MCIERTRSTHHVSCHGCCVWGVFQIRKQKPREELPLLNSRAERVSQVPVQVLLDQHSWGQPIALGLVPKLVHSGTTKLWDGTMWSSGTFRLRFLESMTLTCVFWHLAHHTGLKRNVKRKHPEGQGKQRWGLHPLGNFVLPGTMPTVEGQLCWPWVVTGMLLADMGAGFYMAVTAWWSPGLAGIRSRFRSSLDAACSLDVVLKSPC